MFDGIGEKIKSGAKKVWDAQPHTYGWLFPPLDISHPPLAERIIKGLLPSPEALETSLRAKAGGLSMNENLETDYVEFKHTGTLSAGNDWMPEGLTPSKGEVYEMVSLELFPPQDAGGALQSFRHISPTINDEIVGKIYPREFQLPYVSGDPTAPSARITSLGNPVLGGSGADTPVYATCPKVNYGQELGIKVQNDGTDITDNFLIRAEIRKFSGSDAELQNLLGAGTIDQSIGVSNPYKGTKRTFNKKIPVSLESFDELNGGINAGKPKAERWIAWATNKNATTTNTRYALDYPERVNRSFQEMHFNVDETEAYLINNLAVEPSANLKNTIVELTSRPDNRDSVFHTRNDDTNMLWSPMPTDGSDVNAIQSDDMPYTLVPTQKVFADKGGIAILDDGTSISSGNVLVGVWGYHLDLK